MAQTVDLWGATYSNVPALLVPSGNGTVRFSDATPTTAVEEDVAEGKIFLKADGSLGTGTATGGGGSGYTLTTIAAQQTVTPTSNGTYYGATLSMSTGLESGADYIVTFNGTEYYFTCQVLWGNNYLLGDINYFYGNTGLPYPFGIIWVSGSTCTMAVGSGSSVTVKIEKIELVDEPITPPVLVTKSITANGTFNAEDDNADGYSSVTVNVSGGASSWTLIGSGSFTVNTTSTTQTNVGSVSCGSNAWTADDIIFVHVRGRSGKRNGYFYGSDTLFLNYNAPNNVLSDFTSPVNSYINVSSSGQYSVGSGYYGVYGYNLKTTGDVVVRSRYNNSNSRTINDTFDVYVYKLVLPNNWKVFT